MCGIVGLWVVNGPRPAHGRFDAFVDSLAHRGPDGRGVWFGDENRLALGHRRLAIIDPSPQSNQPMLDDSGRYAIVFNGEIYNFIELRQELMALGHRFRTDGDTEVILAAYRQWGEDCQLHFNGMWAFAIWDARERRLFLSRDRFGVKPLHYFWDGERFAFASEMKAFLQAEGYHYALDEGAVAQALADYTGLEATERCLLQGIQRLIGGYCMTIDADGRLKKRRWWRTLDHLPEVPQNHEDRVAELRDLLVDATRIRLRSDVSLGTALSGGLDSSSVLACGFEAGLHEGAERLPKSWRTAFIADFPGTVQDETGYAVEMANHAGAETSLVRINPKDALDNLPEILFSLEEVYDIPAALWLTYRAMRQQGIVVSMDGHGGDEIFAGYHHYPVLAYQDAMRSGRLAMAKKMADTHGALHAPGIDFQRLSVQGNIIDYGVRRSRRFLAAGTGLVKKTVRNAGLMPVARRLAALAGISPQAAGAGGAGSGWLAAAVEERHMPVLEADLADLPYSDSVTRQLYIDFHATTLPTILRNFDRMSMASGVEIRAPFMDYRVACFGHALPWREKLDGRYSKAILRKSMQGLIPDNIRLRRDKLGFVFPMTDWAREHMQTFIMDHLTSQEFRQSSIWNGKQISNDVENSFAENDMVKVRHAWPFLQASILGSEFKRKSNNKNQ